MQSNVISSLEAIRSQELAVLEANLGGAGFHEEPWSRHEIAALWEGWWEAWEERGQAWHIPLGAFMAALKTAHPWLPSTPVWAALSDVEEE